MYKKSSGSNPGTNMTSQSRSSGMKQAISILGFRERKPGDYDVTHQVLRRQVAGAERFKD